MQKKLSTLIVLLLLVSVLAGCTQNQNTNTPVNHKISIVATIFPQYDFARAIIDDRAELTMLVKPGTEIHSFDPSPADIIKIQKADVFIYIGGESDAWVNTILESMDITNKKVIRLMDCVTTVEEEIIEGMEVEDNHSQGDEEEPEIDEHIWTSPKNAILMINAVSDALCEVDAGNAGFYKKNAEAYCTEIQKIDDKIRAIVAGASNKLLVFGDRFPFRYFADEFGLEYRAAFNGCSTETEASAGTLAFLINTVKDQKISNVFYIELSNQNIANSISEQTGTGTLLLHSCQNVTKDEFESGVTYLSLMEQNAENLRKGLN